MGCRYFAAILAILLSCAYTEDVEAKPLANTTDIDYLNYFGEMYQYIKTEEKVYHMEPDLYEPGNILFSDGHSLKTTDGFQTTNIVGNATQPGHAEDYGEDARFHALAGFHQINSTMVIGISWGKHCLVAINRITRYSTTFAGSCNNPGDIIGDKDQALFRHPSTMIANINNPSQLFFADNENKAVKAIDVTTGMVSVLMRSDVLGIPKSMAFDRRDTAILYVVSAYFIVLKFNMSDNSTELIAGKYMNEGLADGYYTDAQFIYPREIIQVANDIFAIADQGSNRVKILDVEEKMVTSICNSTQGSANGGPLTCELDSPRALLLLNGTLFVGNTGAIRALTVNMKELECLHGCEKSNKPSNQHSDKLSCNRNITATTKPGENNAEVKISEDRMLLLDAGFHTFYNKQTHCYTNVFVEDHSMRCPATVTKAALAGTRIARIELVVDGVTQAFTLPVGSYPFYIENAGTTCQFSLVVTDPNVKRRLMFQAQYDSVDCSSLNDSSTELLVYQAAREHYIQIDEVCRDVCKADKSQSPSVQCTGSTMSINWSTNIIYDSDVTAIDPYLLSILSARLQEKRSMLSTVLLTPTIRVLYPTPTADGSSAKVLLTTYCFNGFIYDEKTDSCPY